MTRHVLGRHPEWIGLNLKAVLSASQSLLHDRIDLSNALIRHGVAAGRRARAMHHQRIAGIAKRRFQTVRIAEIERDIILRLRIQHASGDMVETFRRLPVSVAFLRAEFAGPAAHRVGLQERIIACAVDLPDLQLTFLLENANQHRACGRHALFRHVRDDRT